MTEHNQRCITAFGSSRITEEDSRFTDVEALSMRIAQAGWHGLTGGHQGMMAAFSRGMERGGADVVGVTLERFPTPPNNSLHEEQRAANFFERMQTLIEQADAYLVLPGGLGTMAELAMTWDLLAIQVLEPRPLIIYGTCWKPVIESMQAQLVMSVDHGFSCIHYCDSHEEVLSHLT